MPRRGLAGLFLVLPLMACRASSRDAIPPGKPADPAAAASTGTAGSAAAADAMPPPVIPILTRFAVQALYEVLPVGADRADYSGIAVRSEDSAGVVLWLADDKATRLEGSLYEASLAFGDPRTHVQPLHPAPLAVANPDRLPTGDDVEDIGWVPAHGGIPAMLAAVGERGPRDQPVSWYYLLIEDDPGLRLVRSALASPPGESVGNDGLEGVAARRLASGNVEVLMFKERPAPTYVLRHEFAWNESTYVEASPNDSGSIGAMSAQSGAAFPPSGDRLYVVDRSRRRLAGLETFPATAFAGGGVLDGQIREWLDYAAVDSLLEGRSGDTPPSLYGVVEGVAEDGLGRLYLLADNNETRHSRLLVLIPRLSQSE